MTDTLSNERLAYIEKEGDFAYYGWPQPLVAAEAVKLAAELRTLRAAANPGADVAFDPMQRRDEIAMAIATLDGEKWVRLSDHLAALTAKEQTVDLATATAAVTSAKRVPSEDYEACVKNAVSRFLNWKLPENFSPDGGIAFSKYGNYGTGYQFTRYPSGTNLLDAHQAESMVRHILSDTIPQPAAVPDYKAMFEDAVEKYNVQLARADAAEAKLEALNG